MHGKKQACEKNTSSRWLYKHHTRKILLIFPSLSFSYLNYISLGCAAAREFFRYFTALFPLRNLPDRTGTLLYCTVLIDPILTVKSAAAASSSSSCSSLHRSHCIPSRCAALLRAREKQ